MNYEVGDLLVGKHKGDMFMIKKIIEINRTVMNGVYTETIQGYRIANLKSIDIGFVVAEDEMSERFALATTEDK